MNFFYLPVANNNLDTTFALGTFNFVGGGLTTTLNITSSGVDNVDAIIDNIAITTTAPAVPEPGTWALMLLGFGAVGYSMRRCRKATAVPRSA